MVQLGGPAGTEMHLILGREGIGAGGFELPGEMLSEIVAKIAMCSWRRRSAFGCVCVWGMCLDEMSGCDFVSGKLSISPGKKVHEVCGERQREKQRQRERPLAP